MITVVGTSYLLSLISCTFTKEKYSFIKGKEEKHEFLYRECISANCCGDSLFTIFGLVHIFYLILYGVLVPDVLLQILLVEAYLATHFHGQSSHASSAIASLCHGK